MKKQNPSRLFSSFVIVFLCTAGSIGVGWFLSYLNSLGQGFPFDWQPARLASPPAKLEIILGIIEPGGFRMADPLVRTVDGKLYTYSIFTEKYTQYVDRLPESTRDTLCEQGDAQHIEAVAHQKIVSCRAIQPEGEWCPEPVMVYAITAEGDLWASRKDAPFCEFRIWLTLFLSGMYGLPGCIIGIVIAAAIWMSRKTDK